MYIIKSLKDEDDEEQYDPNKSKKRGAGPKINVKKSNKLLFVFNYF